MAEAPLKGLKVVELARILAGPWIGQTLADLGAQVGQGLADPRAGEDARQLDDAQPFQRGGHQAKACSPVMARPRISAWTSCVPS